MAFPGALTDASGHRLEIPHRHPAFVRPATRKFVRELDQKIERLSARVAQFEAGQLAASQNPGYDRMAEGLFLKGDWVRAKQFAAKAAAHWESAVERASPASAKCEPIFHLGSAWLFCDNTDRARSTFREGIELYVTHGLAGSDDTGYMAVVAGDLRRAEVIFHAAVVADMTAQGMGDLKRFAKRFPDTPRLLKLQFAKGLSTGNRELVASMGLMERWLNPEAEGITSFRTEEWFYAAHQVVLAQLARGEEPHFRLYDEDVVPGLQIAR
jgi:hypothetical protein